jgi:hypothetical protein
MLVVRAIIVLLADMALPVISADWGRFEGESAATPEGGACKSKSSSSSSILLSSVDVAVGAAALVRLWILATGR